MIYIHDKLFRFGDSLILELSWCVKLSHQGDGLR